MQKTRGFGAGFLLIEKNCIYSATRKVPEFEVYAGFFPRIHLKFGVLSQWPEQLRKII